MSKGCRALQILKFKAVFGILNGSHRHCSPQVSCLMYLQIDLALLRSRTASCSNLASPICVIAWLAHVLECAGR